MGLIGAVGLLGLFCPAAADAKVAPPFGMVVVICGGFNDPWMSSKKVSLLLNAAAYSAPLEMGAGGRGVGVKKG